MRLKIFVKIHFFLKSFKFFSLFHEKDLAPKSDGMMVTLSNREDSSELYYRFVCANISPKMDWKALKNYFRKEFLNIPWDEITFCDIYDKPNEQGERWGCVEFRRRENAIIFLKEFYRSRQHVKNFV